MGSGWMLNIKVIQLSSYHYSVGGQRSGITTEDGHHISGGDGL